MPALRCHQRNNGADTENSGFALRLLSSSTRVWQKTAALSSLRGLRKEFVRALSSLLWFVCTLLYHCTSLDIRPSILVFGRPIPDVPLLFVPCLCCCLWIPSQPGRPKAPKARVVNPSFLDTLPFAALHHISLQPATPHRPLDSRSRSASRPRLHPTRHRDAPSSAACPGSSNR